MPYVDSPYGVTSVSCFIWYAQLLNEPENFPSGLCDTGQIGRARMRVVLGRSNVSIRIAQ